MYQRETTKTSLTAVHLYIYCTHVNRKRGVLYVGGGITLHWCVHQYGGWGRAEHREQAAEFASLSVK